MDRVSERFALRCRWASVSLAVVLAFACHLDSIALLEKLSTDTELRASLVQSTDTMVNRASEVFAASSDAYAEAVIRLKASNADAQVLAPPPSFFSIDAAEDWIRTQIGDSARAQTLIDEYDAILQKVLKEKTGRLASVADSVRADFKKTRFIIIPSPYPQWPFGWRAIAGMIVSSLLLSLGAPFWYNVLKNLASLRPRVAAIVQQGGEEPEQKPATPEG